MTVTRSTLLVALLMVGGLIVAGCAKEMTGLAHSDSAAESQQIFCSDPTPLG